MSRLPTRPLALATKIVQNAAAGQNASSGLRPAVMARCCANGSKRFASTNSRNGRLVVSRSQQQQAGGSSLPCGERLRARPAIGASSTRAGERRFWSQAAVYRARNEDDDDVIADAGEEDEEEEEEDIDDMFDEEEDLKLDMTHLLPGGGGLRDRGMHIKLNSPLEEQDVTDWLQSLEEKRNQNRQRYAGRKKQGEPEYEVEDTFVFGTDQEDIQQFQEMKEMHERGELTAAEIAIFKRLEELMGSGDRWKATDDDLVRRAEMEEMEESTDLSLLDAENLPAPLAEVAQLLAKNEISQREYYVRVRDFIDNMDEAEYARFMEEYGVDEEDGMGKGKAAFMQELDECIMSADSEKREEIYVHGQSIGLGAIGVHQMNLAMSKVSGSSVADRYEKMVDILAQCAFEGINGNLATYQMLYQVAFEAKKFEELASSFEQLQAVNGRQCIDITLDTLYCRVLGKMDQYEKAFAFIEKMFDTYDQVTPDLYGDLFRYGNEFAPLWAKERAGSDEAAREAAAADPQLILSYVREMMGRMGRAPYVRPTKYIVSQALDLVGSVPYEKDNNAAIDFAMSLLKELQESSSGVVLSQGIWNSVLSLFFKQNFKKSDYLLKLIEEISPDCLSRRRMRGGSGGGHSRSDEIYFYGLLMRIAAADGNLVVAKKLIEYAKQSATGLGGMNNGFIGDFFGLLMRFPHVRETFTYYYPLFAEHRALTTEVYEHLMQLVEKQKDDPAISLRLVQDMGQFEIPASQSCNINVLKACANPFKESGNDRDRLERVARHAVVIDTAFALFNRGSVYPDSYTLGHMVQMCAEGGQFRRTLDVLRKMQANYPEVSLTSTTLEQIFKKMTNQQAADNEILELTRFIRERGFPIKQNDKRSAMMQLRGTEAKAEFEQLVNGPGSPARASFGAMPNPLRASPNAKPSAIPGPDSANSDRLAELLRKGFYNPPGGQ